GSSRRTGSGGVGVGTEQGRQPGESGVEFGDLSLIRTLLRTEDPGGARVPEERIGDIAEDGGATGGDRPELRDVGGGDGGESATARNDRSAVGIREHGAERCQRADAAVG